MFILINHAFEKLYLSRCANKTVKKYHLDPTDSDSFYYADFIDLKVIELYVSSLKGRPQVRERSILLI